jgi:hypothetical protein
VVCLYNVIRQEQEVVSGGEREMMSPTKLILAALALLLIGVALPFLMVLEVLTSTLPLNFIAAASSTTGFVLGIVGLAQYVAGRRK